MELKKVQISPWLDNMGFDGEFGVDYVKYSDVEKCVKLWDIIKQYVSYDHDVCGTMNCFYHSGIKDCCLFNVDIDSNTDFYYFKRCQQCIDIFGGE